MKARKILAVSLTAAMTLALAACGGSSSDKESSSKDSSDKVYKIGICQQLEHAALDEATKGFEEACEEKFGKDKVKFDLQNGQGEQANCATIVNNFVAENDDLILALLFSGQQLQQARSRFLEHLLQIMQLLLIFLTGQDQQV